MTRDELRDEIEEAMHNVADGDIQAGDAAFQVMRHVDAFERQVQETIANDIENMPGWKDRDHVVVPRRQAVKIARGAVA